MNSPLPTAQHIVNEQKPLLLAPPWGGKVFLETPSVSDLSGWWKYFSYTRQFWEDWEICFLFVMCRTNTVKENKESAKIFQIKGYNTSLETTSNETE